MGLQKCASFTFYWSHHHYFNEVKNFLWAKLTPAHTWVCRTRDTLYLCRPFPLKCRQTLCLFSLQTFVHSNTNRRVAKYARDVRVMYFSVSKKFSFPHHSSNEVRERNIFRLSSNRIWLGGSRGNRSPLSSNWKCVIFVSCVHKFQKPY